MATDTQAALESAIPPRHQCPRTHPAKTPDNYAPPYPAYTARFPETTSTLAIAILGAQSAPKATLPSNSLTPLLHYLRPSAPSAPTVYDIASSRDRAGAHTLAALAYWPSPAAYTAWAADSGFDAWFASLDPAAEPHGWFREVLFPGVEGFETIFSDAGVPEGAARLAEGMSGEIREHVYWGSMRDRLPGSQTDGLVGEEVKGVRRSAEGGERGGRVKVEGRKNLCVIRSGQDWSATTPEERKKYLETMHPVLEKGMQFLRDEGQEVGCFECRMMEVHEEGDMEKVTDKTFGLAYFNDIGALEGWAKDHKTHLDIFGRFLEYTQELDLNISLRLFHEVLVLQPHQQLFEYVGCHEGTGMLSALGS